MNTTYSVEEITQMIIMGNKIDLSSLRKRYTFYIRLMKRVNTDRIINGKVR
jgi:hypothetical protein